MVSDRGRARGLGGGRCEEADGRRIEAVGVEREMLDPSRLLPELVEDLVGVGARRRAATRAAHPLDRLRRDIARYGREGESVGDQSLLRIELAGADQRGPELRVGVRVVDDD